MIFTVIMYRVKKTKVENYNAVFNVIINRFYERNITKLFSLYV